MIVKLFEMCYKDIYNYVIRIYSIWAEIFDIAIS